MPAPAVIPALKVYINAVVVKTPVVDLRVSVVAFVRLDGSTVNLLVDCCLSFDWPRSFTFRCWKWTLFALIPRFLLGVRPIWYNRKQIRVLKASILLV